MRRSRSGIDSRAWGSRLSDSPGVERAIAQQSVRRRNCAGRASHRGHRRSRDAEPRPRRRRARWARIRSGSDSLNIGKCVLEGEPQARLIRMDARTYYPCQWTDRDDEAFASRSPIRAAAGRATSAPCPTAPQVDAVRELPRARDMGSLRGRIAGFTACPRQPSPIWPPFPGASAPDARWSRAGGASAFLDSALHRALHRGPAQACLLEPLVAPVPRPRSLTLGSP